MRYVYLGVIAVNLILASCVTMPLLKSSDAGNIQIIAPEATSVSENDLAVSLEFMGTDRGAWKFMVRVKNQLDSVLVIKPSNLVCQLNQTHQEQNAALVPALTIAGELERIQKERAVLKNAYVRHNQVQLVDATFDLVDAIIPDRDKRTLEEENAERIRDLEQEVSDLKFNESYKKKLADLDSEETFWRSEILKDTELGPGEMTEGLVYFPVQEYEGSLQIFLQFYPYRYVQKFEQRVVKVPL